MSIDEIKKMLSNLIEYENSKITHTVPGLIELIYSKESQSFQVTTLDDGNVSPYYDVNTASEALYTLLSAIKKE
ncbi:Uncharacterised protein [Priestia megaterium]|uniref:hypothetical protein n=1 Tax=Priestia TaxID=2800373 RepID=UPI000E18C2F8|nr:MULTISPECIES: hypothetical protein [Priestia]WJN47552.1 hypothetical protein QUH71_26665 [Priestia aryabhattai]SUY82501.1 Uncharacterised protein [Priestia megaterium]